MSQHYDIFLVAAPKDYNKIEFSLGSIAKYMSGYQNIYLCTPRVLPQSFVSTLHYQIHYRTDLAVLRVEPRRWRYRPNWIYQQFIKLFQNETKNDWYFVMDVDTILNKPLAVWKGERPIWRISWDQNNYKYYNFQKTMFGYGRVYGHSFLADMGFYQRSMISEMLSRNGYTIESFIKKSYQVITDNCYPSEADLYMSHVIKNHPDFYDIQQINNRCNAREGTNPQEKLWSREDIIKTIEEMRATDYDTFAIHSWIDKSHNDWQVTP